MADVVIYTTDYCPYCTRAKSLLRRKNVTFKEVDVSSDQEKREWLRKTTGQRTVPQVFINDRPVGGSDDLHELERTGKLDTLLAEPARS